MFLYVSDIFILSARQNGGGVTKVTNQIHFNILALLGPSVIVTSANRNEGR